MTRRRSGRRRREKQKAGRIIPTLVLTAAGIVFIGAATFTFTRTAPIEEQSLSPLQPPPLSLPPSLRETGDFVCTPLSVTDGDTLRCGEERIRLVGIDAPEMPGHCRKGRECVAGDPLASKAMLEALTGTGDTACVRTGTDRYGRTLASCSNQGINLSCELVARGGAVIRYGGFPC